MTIGGVEIGLSFLSVNAQRCAREAKLIARIRGGDINALGEAYDAYNPPVRAFCRRFLGDESAAEDLLQDTFVALPRALARFRGDSSLSTFLVAVAVNRARNHLRGAIRQRAVHHRLESLPTDSPENPETHAERKQLVSALTRALDTLPEEQRVAIVLCEVEERSSSEAAAIVGVPEGTIRTRIFHGKRKLREQLTETGVR